MARVHKYWCGTDNTLENFELWSKVFTDDMFKYLAFQVEEGTHRHYQWFIQLRKKVGFKTLKALLPNGCHIEPCKGNEDQNQRYVTKPETWVAGPWIFGKLEGQGHRTDIDEFIESLKKRKRLPELWAEHPKTMLRYRKIVDVYHSDNVPERTDLPTVIAYWGRSGSGKSRAAKRYADDMKLDVFWSKDGHWWDGYIGQPIVIIDDFNWRKFDFTEMLHLLDCYPHRVRVKGAFMNFNSPHIIITSNENPKDWYKGEPYNEGQVLRRLTHVQQFL